LNSITTIENEIVNEFSLLDGDQEMTLYYLMELGQKLPVLSEDERREENVVKGCQSKVWLTARAEGNKMILEADSNTAITKGLVSLLVRVFSGQTPDDVLATELTFMNRIGLDRFIGTQRSNGFAAMIKQIKFYAFAFKTQLAGI
jgi:cysteine desulfuration protein SufE